LLDSEPDINVVGEAGTGRQAVEMTRTLRPAVVVMDLVMPGLNGLEATRQILKAVPATRVLILSAHSDDAYAEEAAALGAAGYVNKQTSARVLAKAIRAVHQGTPYFSPAITRRLRRSDSECAATGRPPRKTIGGLSSREVEVLQRIAEGESSRRIATELGLGVRTVEEHRANIIKKLGVKGTAGLTRFAITAGLIECSVRLTIV
jgi:DNA-binding NarL/FixJ family response regulator